VAVIAVLVITTVTIVALSSTGAFDGLGEQAQPAAGLGVATAHRDQGQHVQFAGGQWVGAGGPVMGLGQLVADCVDARA
jgi:hypothetical protein